MSPAINFGNWLRKVCPWIRENTSPLGEYEPMQELPVVDQIVFNVAEVYLYLGDEALFRKYVAYKTQGLLTKAFPPVTLKELREWKKENRDDYTLTYTNCL